MKEPSEFAREAVKLQERIGKLERDNSEPRALIEQLNKENAMMRREVRQMLEQAMELWRIGAPR
jgi:F0F1-type ATP synthase membrane subunit b/b'